MKQTIEEKLKLLPTDPGCYLMKNKFNDIIYVGKAKNLKQRVSSYFTGAHDHKTTKMISQIEDFDMIITSTEKESLILEMNLIKKHRPRYNILFMDDKSYPYLRLNRKGMPRVEVSRDRKHKPEYYYFGPYPDATAARNTARVLNETFPSEKEFLPNTQAIYNKFNRTKLELSDDQQEKWRQNLVTILNGNVKLFENDLKKQMMEASEKLNFELAQNLKDKLEAIQYISDRQQVQFSRREEFDMFHYAYHQGYIAIVGFFVRNGRLLERSMALEACMEEPTDALLSFIVQFYENQPYPKKIYIPFDLELEETKLVVDTDVAYSYRGKKRTLMEIAEKNAKNQLEDQFSVLRKRLSFKEEALSDLADVMNFEFPIERIEIFDNSHLSGDFTVSSCVVYDNGEPNKKEYRRYRLEGGADDIASMREVLYRRYFRLLKESKTMPDLILIDGGQAQLNAGLAILKELQLDIRIASLIKDDRHRTHALLTDEAKKIVIEPSSSMYSLLASMQDEVHRYVISYHRKLRKKAMTRSILDEVPGIGSVRKKKLYNQFKSLKRMREASIEDLSEVIPDRVAKELHAILQINWKDKE